MCQKTADIPDLGLQDKTPKQAVTLQRAPELSGCKQSLPVVIVFPPSNAFLLHLVLALLKFCLAQDP